MINLVLIRAEGRQQELAIRAALGAGSRRIARELLVEHLVLALIGGAAGLALAYAALPLLLKAAPAGLPRIGEIGIDVTVLAFALGISVLSGLVFGFDAGLQDRRSLGRLVAAQRRTHGESEPRTSSRAKHARGRAGGARARADRRLPV